MIAPEGTQPGAANGVVGAARGVDGSSESAASDQIAAGSATRDPATSEGRATGDSDTRDNVAATRQPLQVTRQGAATSDRLGRWREILYMLVLRDLKARTKQAYLGYLWVLIQPLLLTGVFSFLIQQVLGRTNLSEIPYPVFLMAGVIPWQFFANSLNESADSLVKNVDLVRQVYFPREILAIYPVFARLIDVAIGCGALAVFMLVWHVQVSGWVILLPVIIAEEMLFAAACGMLLSAANVAWRDVSRGLPLVLFLMLYAVPVLYGPEQIPGPIRPLFDLNPIARLVDTFRAAVVGTHAPDLIALAVVGLLGLAAVVLAQRIFAVFDGVLADVI